MEKKQVCISHIEASGCFWLQLVDKNKSLLDDVETYLKAADMENYRLESLPLVNHQYTARHPNNGNWQRAKIISASETQVEVLFIDYGEFSYLKTVLKFIQFLY